jgi:thiamine pyridinylase
MRIKVVAVVFIVLSASVHAQNDNPAPARVRFTLRVALFPYLPDAANDSFREFQRRIKHEFEAQNPSIELVLHPMDPNEDLYDLEKLKRWLSQPPDKDGQHVVEVDSILLRELLNAQVLTAWKHPPREADWHPNARKAATINGLRYGVPHWLCGYFLFSRNKSVAATTTSSALAKALADLHTPIPNLSGNFVSSWDLPVMYLNAWAETYGPAHIEEALSPVTDRTLADQLKLLSDECKQASKNPCLDKTFKDNDEAAIQFAHGKYDATFGYSERLYLILRNADSAQDFEVSSLPLGKGIRPLLFTDVFTLNRTCSVECQAAASSFAAYMDSPQTQEWILLSKDASKSAPPRYLLPATKSAFEIPGVKNDRFYAALKSAISKASHLPQGGLYDIRSKMEANILDELRK